MAPSADPTKRGDSVEAANETTPLLGVPESGGPVTNRNEQPIEENVPSETAAGNHTDGTPMPYAQVLLLCYASLAEPVAYFSIFPYISEMIQKNGDFTEESVGYLAGTIESLFSLVQMVLMIFYGRMADRIGRKPVLVFSLAGISICTALFGLSKTLWQMIFFRCLAGTFAGSVVTVRTMLSENSTKATQGRAFSWYMFARNFGIFLGPVIGGGLANPAIQFPSAFHNAPFFKDYPYALSGFAAAAIAATATLANMFLIKETLNRNSEGSSKPEPPMSTWNVLKSPGVPLVLYIFGHTTLLGLAYTAVAPVFMPTSVVKGGFNFSPQYNSYVLAVGGLSQALWMLLAFPFLQRQLGTGNVLRCCAVVWPLFMALYPILNEFLRHEWTTAFWAVGIPSVVMGSGVAMAFACVQLCINDVSPSQTVLATVNALALTVSSAIRAVAPVLFGSIYATGVELRWADGHLVWFILIAIAAGLNIAVRFLPAAAEGKINEPPPADAADDE